MHVVPSDLPSKHDAETRPKLDRKPFASSRLRTLRTPHRPGFPATRFCCWGGRPGSPATVVILSLPKDPVSSFRLFVAGVGAYGTCFLGIVGRNTRLMRHAPHLRSSFSTAFHRK